MKLPKVAGYMTNQTFSGKDYPGMPSFDNWEDELDWIEKYESENGLGEPSLDDIIGEIAKYLPMSASPTEVALWRVAVEVAEGRLTAQEAANRLHNKKVIIKR